MLKPGRYVAENNDGAYLDRYRIVMDVKETEKSYCFKMVEYDNRYGYDHNVRWQGTQNNPKGQAKRSCHAGMG